MSAYELIEVVTEKPSVKLLTVQSADGLYRGALYNPVKASAPAVKQTPKQHNPLYRDQNGLPVMFPGARKIRKAILAAKRKEEGLPQIPEKKPRKIRNRPKDPAGTGSRGETYLEKTSVLQWLNFADYSDYLDSELWKQIRESVFKIKGTTCCLCPCEATEIHHHSYGVEVMNGTDLNPLFPICRKCHHSIDMNRGRKRSLREVQEHFRSRLRKWNKQIGKIDSKIPAQGGGLPDAVEYTKPEKNKKRRSRKSNESAVKKARPPRISEHERNQREDKLRSFRSKMKNTSVMKKDAEKNANKQ